MEKRHQDLIMNRLEDANLNGCSHFTWEELYRWYDVRKIAAKTYRDLEDRWIEISQNKAGCLMMIQGRGGIFVYGEKMAEKVDPNNLMHNI